MSPDAPDFSIVTPSFNMLKYLPVACSSVADQQGATFEHTVVDAVSTDGTVEWLEANAQIRSIVEPDEGMYDAINKGWLASKGRFLVYLNCDDQFLPGALATVKQFFDTHPDVDWVYADYLMIKPDGNLLHYRKAYPPRRPYIQTSFLNLGPSTMFLRRHIIEQGFLFNTYYRCSGDTDFVVRLLEKPYVKAHLRHYLYAAMVTGHNMVTSPRSIRESNELLASAPAWLRRLRYPITAIRLAEKMLHGAYSQATPLEYRVYTLSNHRTRTHFSVESPMWRFTGFDSSVD